MAQQKKVFLKGINTDISDELLPDGVDRYRLNLRVLSSESGNYGAIETMNGNTLVDIVMPTGVNTVIGSYEDELQKKIYYFVHNSGGEHSVLEYDQTINVIVFVLKKAELNFSLSFLITAVNTIRLDVQSHLLYWTDGYNQPRKVNIEKAKNYTKGDYINGYKQSFEPSIINRIKKPPVFPLTYLWSSSVISDSDKVVVEAKSISNQYFIDTDGSTSIPSSFTMPFTENPAIFNSGFDNGTKKWTVPTTGYYNLDVLFKIKAYRGYGNIIGDPDRDNFKPDTSHYIYRNGVIIKALEINHDNTSFDMFYDEIISISNIKLNAGDILYVESIVNKRPASDVTTVFRYRHQTAILKAVKFQAVKLGTVTNTSPNYLFNKLFQFKYRYIYDDYEVSAFSPISAYYLPRTTGDYKTGDNVIAQDDRITLTLNTGSSIVKKIQIAAKELNDLDFNIVAEIDKTELSLSDNSSYQYLFLNNGVSRQIVKEENDKLFDNVPLKCISQEIIKGERIVDGNITEGFNLTDVDMKLDISYEYMGVLPDNTHYPTKSYPKCGGNYIYGIAYYNEANQSSVTNIKEWRFDELKSGKYGTNVVIPFINQQTSPLLKSAGVNIPLSQYMFYCPIVTANIYNKAPSWATHYQIVRTKNLAITKYIQFVCNGITYEDGVPSTATYVDIEISNIWKGYKDANTNSILAYEFAKGDRIRIIANHGATSSTLQDVFDYNDVAIDSYDDATGKIRVTIPAAVSQTNNPYRQLGAGFLYEIYTPQLITFENEVLTYEIAEYGTVVSELGGSYVHNGQSVFDYSSVFCSSNSFISFIGVNNGQWRGFSVGDRVKVNVNKDDLNGKIGTVTLINGSIIQISITHTLAVGITLAYSGFISKGAKIEISGGDSFRRVQNMPYNTGSSIVPVESMNVNNMFLSMASDEGRPNKVDKNAKEVTRPSTIYYSEKFIPETFINGLSSVYDLNFETYNQNYGGIYKLYSEDDVLLMLQESKVGQIGVERIIYSDLQNNNTVGASSKTLSPEVIYYKGEYGIGVHPHSFTSYGNVKYGVDVKRGVIWRLSNDGLTPISDLYGMHNYVTDKCADILRSSQKVNILGVFDIKFNEYVICFGSYLNKSNVLVAGETLSFNEKENAFGVFYSYVPESIIGNSVNIVSFKAGKLYTHNTNLLQSNFYGIQYYPEIWTVCNESPSNVKVLEAFSEETNDAWAIYEVTTPNGQKSNLIESDFQMKENLQYAPFLRDENTPNVQFPLINGDQLRDRTFLCKLKYNKSSYNKLYALNFKYIASNLHNK